LQKELFVFLMIRQENRKNQLLLNQPLRLVVCLPAIVGSRALFQGDFMQANILDGRPDNGEATGLSREDVDLISPLPHIAEQTLNGVGGLNVSVHPLRKRIKRQEVLFVLNQASHRFGIAHSVLGFERGQLDRRLLFCWVLPDTNQFSLHLPSLSSGDGGEHIALFMRASSLGEG